MEIINSKAIIKPLIQQLITVYIENGKDAFVTALHHSILKKKIRFPLLEFAAAELFALIPEKEQIGVIDNIIGLKEIGSNVLAGIILQLRLACYFDQSIEKACTYIISGDQWYVCDIIGERVLGFALLTDPKKTIPVLKRLAGHNDKWIVRTIGVATHYAVKKGLDASYVTSVFELLLSLANTTDFHTKKGIGWGAKTVARFHPLVVEQYAEQIRSAEMVRQWFRTKIKIGLGRSTKK